MVMLTSAQKKTTYPIKHYKNYITGKALTMSPDKRKSD